MVQMMAGRELDWVRSDITLLMRAGTPQLKPLGLRAYSVSVDIETPDTFDRLADCSLAVVFHIKHNWLQISKSEQHSLLCNNLVKTHFYQSAINRENN